MKVVYFGTYRADYSRNRIMMAGLRAVGVEVLECHEPLWGEIDDRVRVASGGWLRLGFIFRVLRAYFLLTWRGLFLPGYDVMICGYPGQFDIFLARFLCAFRRRPLVWDVFMSIYLIMLERGLDKKSRFTARLIRQVESLALRLPDQLIQDTPEYVAWFVKTYGISPARFRLVPTGADNRIFHPLPSELLQSPELFKVLYYGSFIPNHGVPYIIEAARLLKEETGLQFDLVGEGPELTRCRELVEQNDLPFVNFEPWLMQDELVKRIVRADICLGAFGKTPQSLMTIQNKIFEGLATARPVVTGDGPAVRAAFQHGIHLWLVDREKPESLANAIKILCADPMRCHKLAENGNKIFNEQYTIAKLGEQFRNNLEDVLIKYTQPGSIKTA